MFFHHLANLPEDSLAGEFFQLQVERNISGLVTEMNEHIQILGNPNPKNVLKGIWKRKIDSYITEKNKNDVLNDIRKYKKLDFEELSKEKFERKSYLYELNLENARMMFKIKSKVVPTIRKNFSQKCEKKSLSCQSCKNMNNKESSPPEDTQNHVVSDCPAFEHVRVNRDMSNDADLAKFFKEVIKQRLEENED